MFDFTNLVAEYALRVALWPGLGFSLPLALALLWLRRQLPLATLPTPNPSQWGGSNTNPSHWEGSNTSPPHWEGRNTNPSRWEGSNRDVGRDLVSIATALVLLATLPSPGLSLNLPLFGVLPSGQQLADPLFAILLLPLASAALLNTRGQALRWLVAWLPAATALLATLPGSAGNSSEGTLVAILATLACVPLLLIGDALMQPRGEQRAERWLGELAQQCSWLALIALLLDRLVAPLPTNPLPYGLLYGATAIGAAALARLVNRRWPQFARAGLPAMGAALLALLVALLLR